MNIQINNMNARVMMLENSVRVLKDNLWFYLYLYYI